jgi:predicted nucleotidyltransferase
MRINNIIIPQEKISEFCKRWNITEFALFGSVLREDFSINSDVDALVTFAPETRRTLFDISKMQDELQKIFGRNVDVVSKRGVEMSRNYIRRKAILSSAEVIYVS